jgi:hypothetical protein
MAVVVREPDFAIDGTSHNAAVIPLYTIQYIARHKQTGTYLLQEAWNSFVVTSYQNIIHFVTVISEPRTKVVVSADQKRTHGRPYRIRLSSAIVTAVYKVNSLQNMEVVDSFLFAPDGARRRIKVGDTIDYGAAFNTNPSKLQGRGLYVSPTYKEAMKLLAYVLRYNLNRLFRTITTSAIPEQTDVFGDDGCGAAAADEFKFGCDGDGDDAESVVDASE